MDTAMHQEQTGRLKRCTNLITVTKFTKWCAKSVQSSVQCYVQYVVCIEIPAQRK